MRPTAQRQTGAATLVLVLGLVLLGSLATAWSSRAVLVDLLVSQSRGQAQQARHAAQAALATAQADVLQAWDAGDLPALFANSARLMSCPSDLPGPRWQCTQLPLSGGQELSGWSLGALAVRDLIAGPHVWQLRGWAQHPSGQGQAKVRESLFVPSVAPVPTDSPNTALLLNGCLAAPVSPALQVCPLAATGQSCVGTATASAVHSLRVPDSDRNGQLSAEERQHCLPLNPHHLPGGGSLTGTAGAPGQGPCNRAAWRQVLGDMTDSQLQAWSDAQALNGLSTSTQPARSVYWIDSPADWTQSLGTPQAPVLLVFSARACALRCPRIAPHVQIHGTVFVDAQCSDDKLQGWQAGTIDGLLAIEGGLPALGGAGRVRARSERLAALALHWPPGIDARRPQRIAGSHREGGL